MIRRKLTTWAAAVVIGLTGTLVAATPAHAATCTYNVTAYTWNVLPQGWGTYLQNTASKSSGPSLCNVKVAVSFEVQPVGYHYRTSDQGYGFWTYHYVEAESGYNSGYLNVHTYSSTSYILWRNNTTFSLYNGSTYLGYCYYSHGSSVINGICSR